MGTIEEVKESIANYNEALSNLITLDELKQLLKELEAENA